PGEQADAQAVEARSGRPARDGADRAHAARAVAVQAGRSLVARWNVLWFRPGDARWLGAMRIALGVLLIVFHVGLWPRLDLFSSHGPVDLRSLHEGWSAERWSYLDG